MDDTRITSSSCEKKFIMLNGKQLQSRMFLMTLLNRDMKGLKKIY